jgi:Uma2 family endonuclease
MSFEDYAEREFQREASSPKHEWVQGVVYAMSRGTPEHGRLTARVTIALGQFLDRGCEVYSADTMLFIEAMDLATYADASIVCGAVKTRDVRKASRSLGHAVTNPSVIVEVLSESTERYDRDGKFQAYQRITSLEEYVLVSQDVQRVEVFRRRDDWRGEAAGAGASIVIRSVPIPVSALPDWLAHRFC